MTSSTLLSPSPSLTTELRFFFPFFRLSWEETANFYENLIIIINYKFMLGTKCKGF